MLTVKKIFSLCLCSFLLLLSLPAALVHAAAAVQDGTYVIVSGLDDSLVLDVFGGSAADKANIQIYKANGSKAQQFRIEKSGKYYRIINVRSGKALDIAGASKANSANVQQYRWNGTDAQLFEFESAGSGCYYIKNVNSGKVLDVKGAKKASQTNVQQYAPNKTAAQKWRLVLQNTAAPAKASGIVSGQIYSLTSAVDAGFGAAVSGASKANKGNVCLASAKASAPEQQWRFDYLNNGYYRITNVNSGKVLDLTGAKAVNAQNLQQYAANGTKAQEWLVSKNADGSYTIASRVDPNFVMDLTGGKAADGRNIQLYAFNDSMAQHWNIVKYSAPPSPTATPTPKPTPTSRPTPTPSAVPTSTPTPTPTPTPAEYYDPADVTFSLEAGSYEEHQLSLELSAPEGYTILYTLNSSEPSVSESLNGSGQMGSGSSTGTYIYSGPLTIKDPGPQSSDLSSYFNAAKMTIKGASIRQDPALPTAVVVRAIAVAPDGTTGNVTTRTYFTRMDLMALHNGAAVISVATDDANLLDYEKGILVLGSVYDAWTQTPGADEILQNGEYWKANANYNQEGSAWARPASIEIFDGSNRVTDRFDGSIHVWGGMSRSFSQKSLIITSDGEREPFVLQNGGNTTKLMKFKDAYMQELAEGMAFSTQEGRPCVLFLNGEYWGAFILQKDYTAGYVAEHFPGIAEENVAIIESGNVKGGGSAAFLQYEDLLTFEYRDLTDPDEWAEFENTVDILSLAEYCASQIYIANPDWNTGHNICIWRTIDPQYANECDDGKWRWMLYDTEYSAGLYGKDETAPEADSLSRVLQDYPLFAAAYQNEEFRSLFEECLRNCRDFYYTEERAEALLSEYIAVWQPHVNATNMRFTDISTNWSSESERILSFFRDRPAILDD